MTQRAFASAVAELRVAVKATVDARDPERLVAMGAPDDGYDAAIDDFTAAIVRGETLTPESVRATWNGWFHRRTSDRPALDELAQQLVAIQRAWDARR